MEGRSRIYISGYPQLTAHTLAVELGRGPQRGPPPSERRAELQPLARAPFPGCTACAPRPACYKPTCFLRWSKRSKGARLGQKSTALNSSWPSTAGQGSGF